MYGYGYVTQILMGIGYLNGCQTQSLMGFGYEYGYETQTFDGYWVWVWVWVGDPNPNPKPSFWWVQLYDYNVYNYLTFINVYDC